MTTKHVEWEGGWADLSDSITHARRMRIVRVLPKATAQSVAQDPSGFLEFGVELAAAHITAWSVGDVDAVRGVPSEAMDALPQQAVDDLRDAALELWTSRADPNASAPSSAPGRSAKSSAAATPTS